jgi:heptosyltransferase-1
VIREIRKERYDVLFDLQGNSKSSIFTFLAKAKQKVGFSRKSVPEWINVLFTNQRFTVSQTINIRQQYLSLVQNFFSDVANHVPHQVQYRLSRQMQKKIASLIKPDSNRICVINIGAKWESKYLNIKLLQKLIPKLYENFGISFYFITYPNMPSIKPLLNQTYSYRLPYLSLLEIYGFLKKADLLISSDSSILHLGEIADIPTVSFFGPSLSFTYKPMGMKHLSFQGTCPHGQVFTKRCKYLRSCSSKACMKDFSIESVLSDIDRLRKNYSVMLIEQTKEGESL